jgi:hypothetical protein
MSRYDKDHPGNPSVSSEQWKPRSYFESPDDGVKPLSFFETFKSILLGHLGVATAEQREKDFSRANGWHVLWVGILYTALVTGLMIGVAVWLSP